jgi:peroxiredoxin
VNRSDGQPGLNRMLRPGDPLPDVPLTAPDGEAVSLARLGVEHRLLIFLRHLT